MDIICTKCKEYKSTTEFYTNKKHPRGFCSHCISCVKIRNKIYREKNAEKMRFFRKRWRLKNKRKVAEYSSKWRKDNRDKVIKTERKYKLKNTERVKEWQREWVKKNPDYHKEYVRKIRLTPKGKIEKNLRARLYLALKGKNKLERTQDLLGCDTEHLKKHLESKFSDGMSWENYGRNGWHIDHIIPCAAFDFSKLEDQKKCFHYTNLQPLWAEDNKRKGSKTHS